MRVTIHQAKTQLSRLLRKVQAGEDVLIARGSEVIARIVPASEDHRPRIPGQDEGKVIVNESFFEPVPEDLLSVWKAEK